MSCAVLCVDPRRLMLRAKVNTSCWFLNVTWHETNNRKLSNKCFSRAVDCSGTWMNWWKWQAAAMPQIGCEMEHPHAGLIHPGFICEVNALQCHGTRLLLALSFTCSEEHCSGEQQTSVRVAGVCNMTAMSFRPLDAIRTHFVLDCTTWAVIKDQSFPIERQVCNWHADSSRRSIVHISRERTAPTDLEPNLSQTSQSFLDHFWSLWFSFANNSKGLQLLAWCTADMMQCKMVLQSAAFAICWRQHFNRHAFCMVNVCKHAQLAHLEAPVKGLKKIHEFCNQKIKIVHIVSVAHSWCDHAIGVTLKVMLNSKEWLIHSDYWNCF